MNKYRLLVVLLLYMTLGDILSSVQGLLNNTTTNRQAQAVNQMPFIDRAKQYSAMKDQQALQSGDKYGKKIMDPRGTIQNPQIPVRSELGNMLSRAMLGLQEAVTPNMQQGHETFNKSPASYLASKIAPQIQSPDFMTSKASFRTAPQPVVEAYGGSGMSQPAPQPPTPTPTPDPRTSWNNFAHMVRNVVTPLGYDANALIRQMANESTWGTSPFAKERYNYGGIGAYDRNPDNAFSFESPEAYLDYYLGMIENRFPEAYKVRGNGEAYIQALKDANYATNPNYVWDVMNTPMYRD